MPTVRTWHRDNFTVTSLSPKGEPMDIDPRVTALIEAAYDAMDCDAWSCRTFDREDKQLNNLAAELSAALLPTDAVERVARFIATEFGDGWDDPDMNDDPEGMQVIRNYWRAVATELLSALTQPAEQCDHEWADMANQVVKNGEICLKCNRIRP